MKRILLLTFLTLFSVKAMAFYFGPVQRVTTIGYDKYTVVEMFVDSKESSDFVFRVGDKKIADKNGVPYKKYVFGGERATFPIKVNNKFIRERSNGKKYYGKINTLGTGYTWSSTPFVTLENGKLRLRFTTI